MTFEDHFSQHSESYSRFRPDYPDDLYQLIISYTTCRRLAWDCATGSGQAALALSGHFQKIVATDASAKQIEYAHQESNIEYRVAQAEDSKIDSHTVDLVAVAQALHWFDGPDFYAEVKRVASPTCVFAAWGYSLFAISPQIDAVIQKIYQNILGVYWPPERRLVELHYQTLSIPFKDIENHQFCIENRWNLSALCNYILTWSSSQRYYSDLKKNPIDEVWPELQEVWGPPEGLKTVVFPVFLKIGRVQN